LDVTEEELLAWRTAADAMTFPFDEHLGVHAQAEDFTSQDEWKFEMTASEHYPLLLNYPYFQIYRKQVVKQADLVLAMHLRGDLFSEGQKARNFAYYEARTVRDSSLSSATQAILAAATRHLRLAYDYGAEGALVDLGDPHGTADDGLGVAARGGARPSPRPPSRSWPPRPVTCSWRTTTGPRARSWPWAICTAMWPTGCTSPPWAVHGWQPWPDSAGCAITAGNSASPRVCPWSSP